MSVLEITKDLKTQIELEAYYLSEKNLAFDELCWMLAEELLKIQRKKRGKIAKIKIQEKAEEVYDLSYKYDDLCWRIAELKVKGK